MKLSETDLGAVMYLANGEEALIERYDPTHGVFIGPAGVWRADGSVLGAEGEDTGREVYERKRVPVWEVALGGYAPVGGPYTTATIRFRDQLEATRFARDYNARHQNTRPKGPGSFLTAEGPVGVFVHERAGIYTEHRAQEFA